MKLKNITQHGILTVLRLFYSKLTFDLLQTLRLQGENSDPSKFTPVIKSAVKLLERVLVFIPEKWGWNIVMTSSLIFSSRLSGKEFLEDPFFEDVLSVRLTYLP